MGVMLILFDIDLTLLTTNGAGMMALGDAGREYFGKSFDETGTSFGGRLDPLIIQDLLVDNGIDPTPENCHAMRKGYETHLTRRLEAEPARALPGTGAMIDQLAGRSDVTLGLLTGNYEATGRLKLASAKLERDEFAICVWGDQSPHDPPAREHLPAVAMERYGKAYGREIDSRRVVIVGDTVHDVSCARANGCRVLAVATGHCSPEELDHAGADRVVPDLADSAGLIEWMVQ